MKYNRFILACILSAFVILSCSNKDTRGLEIYGIDYNSARDSLGLLHLDETWIKESYSYENSLQYYDPNITKLFNDTINIYTTKGLYLSKFLFINKKNILMSEADIFGKNNINTNGKMNRQMLSCIYDFHEYDSHSIGWTYSLAYGIDTITSHNISKYQADSILVSWSLKTN